MQSLSLIQQAIEAQDELIKLLISIILGGIIGWQREHTGHEAGIRTFSSICMGSCLFGIISNTISEGDPGRIAAQVVSGIGFIGIGVIIRDGRAIKGLTTAATLWSISAIGLAVAFNLYVLSVLGTILMFFFLFLTRTKFWHYIAKRPADHPDEVNPDYLHPLRAHQRKKNNLEPALTPVTPHDAFVSKPVKSKGTPSKAKKD